MVLFFVFFAHRLFAASDNDKTTFLNYLTQKQAYTLKSIEALKAEPLPKSTLEFTKQINQLNSFLIIVGANLETLDGFLENHQKLQSHYFEKLKHLQQLPLLTNDRQNVPARVAKTQSLLAENKQLIQKIQESRELSKKYRQDIINKTKELNTWNLEFKLEEQLSTIKKTKIQLNKKLQELYKADLYLHPKGKNAANLIYFEAQTLIHSQQLALVQLEITNQELQRKVVLANKALLHNSDSKTLQFVIDVYQEALSEYNKSILSGSPHITDINRNSY